MHMRLLAVLLLVLAVGCGGDDEEPPTPAPATATAFRTPAPGPSQTVADAQRDGVPPAVAKLRYTERIQERARMRTPEGIWVISRSFDPPKGLEGYGELLLLDLDETRVVRAFPFDDVSPTWITTNDEALYCGRAANGRVPYTLVCRIDRQSFATTVKIYTDDLASWRPADHPNHWVVIGYALEMTDLVAESNALWAKAKDGRWTWLDPNTLTFVQHGGRGPSASPLPPRVSAKP